MSDNLVIYRDLIGQTISHIEGAYEGSEVVQLIMSDGSKWCMWHDQDCCERVQVDEIHGDVTDIIGSPLLQAEAVSRAATDEERKYDDSGTWTFYKFATNSGSVTIRWLGESNGYYSESVEFEKVTDG